MSEAFLANLPPLAGTDAAKAAAVPVSARCYNGIFTASVTAPASNQTAPCNENQVALVSDLPFCRAVRKEEIRRTSMVTYSTSATANLVTPMNLSKTVNVFILKARIP